MGIYIHVQNAFTLKLDKKMDYLDEIDEFAYDEITLADIKKSLKGKWESLEHEEHYLKETLGELITMFGKGQYSFTKDSAMLSIVYRNTPEYKRFDSTLDYYLLDEKNRCQFKYLSANPYGFWENKIVIKNGKELDKELTQFVMRNDWELPKKLKDKLLAKGLTEDKEMLDQVYMKAPPLIRNIFKYLGVKNKDLKYIRPAFMVYER